MKAKVRLHFRRHAKLLRAHLYVGVVLFVVYIHSLVFVIELQLLLVVAQSLPLVVRVGALVLHFSEEIVPEHLERHGYVDDLPAHADALGLVKGVFQHGVQLIVVCELHVKHFDQVLGDVLGDVAELLVLVLGLEVAGAHVAEAVEQHLEAVDVLALDALKELFVDDIEEGL